MLPSPDAIDLLHFLKIQQRQSQSALPVLGTAGHQAYAQAPCADLTMDNLLFLNQLAAANRGAPYHPG